MNEVMGLRQDVGGYDVNELLTATYPIRTALLISMTYSKLSNTFFSSNKAEIIFQQHQTEWRMLNQQKELSEWVYGILIPMAVSEYGVHTDRQT